MLQLPIVGYFEQRLVELVRTFFFFPRRRRFLLKIERTANTDSATLPALNQHC
uniref:Uncharacterized protein n=1 Tax=Anguilla anguilla TaxID=7936 RepID=A0A0E9Q6S0_ANGAN